MGEVASSFKGEDATCLVSVYLDVSLPAQERHAHRMPRMPSALRLPQRVVFGVGQGYWFGLEPVESPLPASSQYLYSNRKIGARFAPHGANKVPGCLLQPDSLQRSCGGYQEEWGSFWCYQPHSPGVYALIDVGQLRQAPAAAGRRSVSAASIP
jgi:hypothetical protein